MRVKCQTKTEKDNQRRDTNNPKTSKDAHVAQQHTVRIEENKVCEEVDDFPSIQDQSSDNRELVMRVESSPMRAKHLTSAKQEKKDSWHKTENNYCCVRHR